MKGMRGMSETRERDTCACHNSHRRQRALRERLPRRGGRTTEAATFTEAAPECRSIGSDTKLFTADEVARPHRD